MAEIRSLSLWNDANLQERWLGDSLTGKNGNVLTNNNSVGIGTVPGRYGFAFDAGASNTNKYLRIANALGYNNGAYSISMQIKLNTELASGTNCFFEIVDSVSGTTLCFDYNFNGGSRQIEAFHLRLGVSSGNVQAVQALGTSIFHQVGLTWDGTTTIGYIDGVSFGTPAANAGTGSGGTSGLTILDQRTAGTSPTSGIGNDIGLWNRKLTAAEMLALATDIFTKNQTINQSVKRSVYY